MGAVDMQTTDPESYKRMQAMKAVPVNKLPEIYKQNMKADVLPEYTAVNPVREAKERKRKLKMMATSIGVQDPDGRPMSARSGATAITGGLTAYTKMTGG